MEAVDKNEVTYKYKFSIVSAVYNAEEYVEEFIKSIIGQSVGFEENVEMILVDDGSLDASAEICERYAEQYPDNIRVLRKENGGVSSARNLGLEYVRGRYVNFCDPDDYLAVNTLKNVGAFFEKVDDKTDIVAIPIFMFGAVSGAHPLNNKFAKGTRLIYLQKESSFMQLSSASAFFRSEALRTRRFNTDLVIAEDADLITRILIEKPCLGVVSGGKYWYRRHAASAVSNSKSKKEFYNNSVRLFSREIIRLAEEKYGYLPRYIQNVLIYDLQWKYQMETAPDVLSAEELAEYKSLLYECIAKIDDEVLWAQRSIPMEIKIHLLAYKQKQGYFINAIENDIFYGADYKTYHKFSANVTELSFLDLYDDELVLSLRQTVLNFAELPVEHVYINIGTESILPTSKKVIEQRCYLGEPVAHRYIYEYRIPRSMLSEKNVFTFRTIVGGADVLVRNLYMGAMMPVTKKYRNSYCIADKYLVTARVNHLVIYDATKKMVRRFEKAYRKEIRKSGHLGSKKAIWARRFLSVYNAFKKKEIWIISDRVNKAGDNGEAFFRYLKESRFKGAKYYYSISKNSADYKRLSPMGNIIHYGSWKYKFLFLACDKIISAHADDVVLNPFMNYAALYQDILRSKDFIFLQHGVIQNDLSGWLNRYNKNIKGFITSTQAEHDSIVDGSYFYTPDRVWLTGLPRFDRLYHDEKRYITLMPTWRIYIMDHMDRDTGVWVPSKHFKESDYFKFYNSLITDERLLAAAKKYGYQICFMPHPNIITVVDYFEKGESVKFFSIDTEYRDVFAQSDLILTDYSSAVFDFAYLHKPIVYSQFDYSDFYGGKHVCKEGYFNYERDGFGEVTYDLDSTVETLIDYMKNDCKLKDKYRERIDSFFAYHDQNNCERILKKILEMK